MLMQANASAKAAAAHVVVLGNEKGGSGKSTTAMHVAVALMNVGQRVATIDLDSRQRSLTRYLENRRSWARHARIALKVPTHLPNFFPGYQLILDRLKANTTSAETTRDVRGG